MKKKKYFYYLFWIFIVSSIFGWLFEVILSFCRGQGFVNHSSLVLGPFGLAYGVGALALSIFLYKFKKSNNLTIFMVSAISSSILEYIMSWGMEYFMGFTAWDYSSRPFNLNGRICLLFALIWGLLGIIWIKIIYPKFCKIIDRINFDNLKIITNTLICFLILDVFLTLTSFYRMTKEIQDIPPSNSYEEFLDKYFGYDYLDNMYVNVDRLKR